MKKILSVIAFAGLLTLPASAASIFVDVSFGSFAPTLTGFNATSTEVTFTPVGPYSLECTGPQMLLCGAGGLGSATLNGVDNDMTSGGLESWTLGSITYTITDAFVVTAGGVPPGVANGLQTRGIFSAVGFDDTIAIVNFSAQAGGVVPITAVNRLSWSAQGSSVPEPGTLSLLGIGLLGVGLWNRQRRKQA